jgi:hypothetical protein
LHVCCIGCVVQVEACTTGRSPVQESPTECECLTLRDQVEN